MDSASFYRYSQNIRIRLPNLLCEFLLRIILLIGVLILHLNQPPPLCITEAEILSEFKKPRRDSFIPPTAMVLTVIIVPFCILCVPLIIGNYLDTVHALLAWTLALLLNAIITEVLKVTIRRPRPDFFYRCFPSGVPSLYCTGNVRDVIEGRKSFPSGHSSFAFCSLGLLSVWMDCIFNIDRLRAKIFCILPLSLASFIGISRIFDNHHHWQDVLGGAVIGFACSYICFNAYCNARNNLRR